MNGWELLFAAIRANPTQPWTDEHSDRLDRLIRQLRNADREQQRHALNERDGGMRSKVLASAGYQYARGPLTPDDLKRRKRAARQMNKQATMGKARSR